MKIIGKIKDVYKSIDQWQQNFRPATKHREDENVCKNCGLHYKGSFCPNCGQTANTKRFTFRNAIMMTLEVWGMGNRSMPRTMLELIVRPGYMIRDYLNGKRIAYFPPVKMLFVFCIFLSFALFVLPVDYLDELSELETSEIVFGEESQNAPQITVEVLLYSLYHKMVTWLDNHKVVELLIIHFFIIMSTFLFFRKTSDGYKLTLTEQFFSQMYIASQMMMLSIIYLFFTLEYSMTDIYPLPFMAMILIYIYNYKQLFGWGWLRTISRTILVFLFILLGFFVILIIFSCIIFFMADNGYLNLDISDLDS